MKEVTQRTRAIEAAASEICAMLRFVSVTSEEARYGLMKLLDRLAAESEREACRQLPIFVEYLLRYYDDWPGPHTIRAVWCSKFPPADGSEATVMSGALAEAIEDRAITAHEEFKRLEAKPFGQVVKLLEEAKDRKS